MLKLLDKWVDWQPGKPNKPILCVDFDGVLHSYTSGWQGPLTIPDPPVPGAIQWLRDVMGTPEPMGAMLPRYKHFRVAIYSSRSRYVFGRWAMKEWLVKCGLERPYLELLEFPAKKPPAFLSIDDRAWCFDGIFPTTKELKGFTTWYRK